jgi:adenine-specific DNA-methyltransferase
MNRLAISERIAATSKGKLVYVRYFDDFPAVSFTSMWSDVGGTVQSRSDPKVFVVQTGTSVIERCILMTTDPGDLVLDPTCGSGTTAYVAEQWGRRWITCDTSRVAVTLAKQRLMATEFDYYELAHPEEGIGSGFRYKTVPHVTLKSIANNPEIREGMSREQIDAAIARYAEQETLYGQPYTDKTRTRVTGPFTVERPRCARSKKLKKEPWSLELHRARLRSRWLIFVMRPRRYWIRPWLAKERRCVIRNGAMNY